MTDKTTAASAKTAKAAKAAPEADPAEASAAEPELSYEQAREELSTVVRTLESGGLSLKESLALWERGERLATTCEHWLEGARAKLAAAMDDGPAQEGDSAAPF